MLIRYLADLTIFPTASQFVVFSARVDVSRNENARWREPPGILLWRRPTLARPIAVLPSGLQRFTSVFGMGTGGATALMSPEVRAGLALEPPTRISGDWGPPRRTPCNSIFKEQLKNNYQLSTIYCPLTLWHLHTGFQKIPRSATAATTSELRFILRSFISSVCRSATCGTG
jgi:hypothetical protein